MGPRERDTVGRPRKLITDATGSLRARFQERSLGNPGGTAVARSRIDRGWIDHPILQEGHSMKFTPTGVLTAAVALVLAATAEAAVIVYTDEAAFLAHTQPGFYRETFTSLPDGPHISPLTSRATASPTKQLR
jgi:hypothetical protein